MTRLGRNIAYNLAGQTALLGIGFVSVRMVFHGLGADVFGVIYFTLTLNTLLVSLLELGLAATTVREVAVHHAADPEHVVGLVRTTSLLYWSAFAILAAGLWLIAPWLVTHWIQLGSGSRDSAILVLRVVGTSALVGLPKTLYASVLRGFQRMGSQNAVDVSFAILQQVGVVAVIVLHGSVAAVAGWYALAFWSMLAVYAVIVARLVTPAALLPGFSRPVVQRTFRFSGHMSAISVMAMAHTQADKVVVSKLLPVATFGSYSFASGVVSKISLLTASVAQAALPSLAALQRDRLREQYAKLHDMVCFFAVPPLAAFAVFSIPLMSSLLSPAVALQLTAPIALLCIGYFMNASITMPYTVSIAVARPDISYRANLYALLITLPLVPILTLRFGMAGAAAGWVAYHVWSYAYAVPRWCRACLGEPALAWFRHVGRVYALAAVTYLPAWLVVVSQGRPSLLLCAIVYAAATVGYGAGTLLLIGAPLRATLGSVSGQILARSRAV
jgi:O-antigen/teichoic acid export membrane protein